jgi:hypothetical protein
MGWVVMWMFGVPETTFQFVVVLFGVVISIGFSIIPMKLILGKDFGKFGLVLIANTPSTQRSTGASL